MNAEEEEAFEEWRDVFTATRFGVCSIPQEYCTRYFWNNTILKLQKYGMAMPEKEDAQGWRRLIYRHPELFRFMPKQHYTEKLWDAVMQVGLDMEFRAKSELVDNKKLWEYAVSKTPRIVTYMRDTSWISVSLWKRILREDPMLIFFHKPDIYNECLLRSLWEFAIQHDISLIASIMIPKNLLTESFCEKILLQIQHFQETVKKPFIYWKIIFTAICKNSDRYFYMDIMVVDSETSEICVIEQDYYDDDDDGDDEDGDDEDGDDEDSDDEDNYDDSKYSYIDSDNYDRYRRHVLHSMHDII